jgi:hypothetical protein
VCTEPFGTMEADFDLRRPAGWCAALAALLKEREEMRDIQVGLVFGSDNIDRPTHLLILADGICGQIA